MKLQNLTVIFLIITIPLILVLTYYITLQRETVALQTSYDEKLITSTKEAMEAFEVNTVEWNSKYSNLLSSKRRDILASINAFTNSLSNNLGMSGASKEYTLNYLPALAYTMYDGYYIYAPTYAAVPYLDEKGLQYYYYGEGITNSTETSRNGIAGKPLYKSQSGEEITTDIKEAKKEYKHILKNYIPYSERIGDIIINFTLDNYIRIFSDKDDKEAEGYLTCFGEGTQIPRLGSGIGIESCKYNGTEIKPEKLSEQILYYTYVENSDRRILQEKQYFSKI